MGKTIVILGATSAIAIATAREFVKTESCHFILVGRQEQSLLALRDDLIIRKALSAHVVLSDFRKVEAAKNCVEEIKKISPKIDVLFVAYGVLGDQKTAYKDSEQTEALIGINFTSQAAYLAAFIPLFESQQFGSIAVISSVAGDRGRQSNFIYGAAKAGMSVYLDGLRHHLYKYKCHVLTIKPGFIDTPMTAGFKKGALWATPEKIAPTIVKAIQKRKTEIYVPGFWRVIMAIIKALPDCVFFKTKL